MTSQQMKHALNHELKVNSFSHRIKKVFDLPACNTGLLLDRQPTQEVIAWFNNRFPSGVKHTNDFVISINAPF